MPFGEKKEFGLTVGEEMQVRLFTELLIFRRKCLDQSTVKLEFDIVTTKKYMIIRTKDQQTVRRIKSEVTDCFFHGSRKPFKSVIRGCDLILTFSGWVPKKVDTLSASDIGEEILR